ncbi:alpha/beta fold hydrolase [Flexivirga oryzae]|uniref:Pimeloyl-ACP methyl ester carboxylesterase n=1 Tax=Flexivirga oryzae TaxID=1794944 RepID=A0A839NGE8_9MICO|nr:alpha/beta hydrolase [Flexivirga oryzae]MBB2893741.1 pimeloyl-ACP methyl ester carboxylesterase [Flexivirga oryzae]
MTLNAVAADHLLDGIQASDVDTDRLRVRVLTRAGQTSGRPLLLVHGNISSSLFYQRLMLALPDDIRPIAPDLRGFGETQDEPIDATRGLGDHVDDLVGLLDALGITSVDAVGWSMGGGVVARLALDAPGRVSTLTLLAPISPYGYGCTRGEDGRLVFADAVGSGGGGGTPRFVELLAAKDPDGTMTDGMPELASPRATLRALYVAPRADPWPDEDLWVASMLTTRTGSGFYPGDSTPSPNWPGFAPGSRGVLNSMAPNHCRWDDLPGAAQRPPVLWIRGAADQIVADAAGLDLAVLGQAGLIPGYPGAEAVPPQPMIVQTRAVLDRYAAAGGSYREVVLDGTGHPAHLERQDDVLAALLEHLG